MRCSRGRSISTSRQNDATVKGMGCHDKSGRHCLVNDPDGKLNVVYVAGYWLRDTSGKPTRALRHICWDGCMFPNSVLHVSQQRNESAANLERCA